MADPNAADRAGLYLGRARPGVVFGQEYSFYSGNPTIPNSFTGNLTLGATVSGPGAFLINGVGPVLMPPESCDEPVLIVQSVVDSPSSLVITIEISNLLPTDTLILFNNFGVALTPSNVQVIPGAVELTFPGTDTLPAGTYALKAIRDGNPDCFDIQYGVFTNSGDVCLLDAGSWGFLMSPFPPVVSPGPVNTRITGSGFTSCTISVEVDLLFAVGPSPATLPVSSLVVVDDNNITFTVDGTAVFTPSVYEAVVSCDDNPGCEDTADNNIVWNLS